VPAPAICSIREPQGCGWIMRQVSPSQRARLDQWFDGAHPNEDENQFLRRMNGILTDSDREWIVEFMDQYNASKRAS
jgi:hypothetical protein